jgi:hypothetical protein
MSWHNYIGLPIIKTPVDDADEWLRISIMLEKEEQEKARKAEETAKANAEAQAIAYWYMYQGSPGAQLAYEIKCKEEEKIHKERLKTIAKWYATESLFAQQRARVLSQIKSRGVT